MSEEALDELRKTAFQQAGSIQTIAVILGHILARTATPEERASMEGALEATISPSTAGIPKDFAEAWQRGARLQLNFIFSLADQVAP